MSRFVVMKLNANGDTYEANGHVTKGHADRPQADRAATELALNYKDETFAVFERVCVVKAELVAAVKEDVR